MPQKHTYKCAACDFQCTVKRLYEQHIKTYKHRLAINDPTLDKESVVRCHGCNEMFGSRTSLWRHKKSCSLSNHNDDNCDETYDDYGSVRKHQEQSFAAVTNESDVSISGNTSKAAQFDILEEVLKETKNLREAFAEQSRTIEGLKKVNEDQSRFIEETLPNMAVSNTTNITNVVNNCNQSYNINLFLNEKCKDAINMSEFIRSIVIQIDDLERTKTLGFVKGVTDIIVKNLRELDVCSRPIHCSDPIQEIMYIKNDNIWAEESKDKPLVRGAISAVAKKQLEKVRDWEQKHNSLLEPDKGTTEYIQMVKQATYQENDDEARILKNIAREVTLNKSSQ